MPTVAVNSAPPVAHPALADVAAQEWRRLYRFCVTLTRDPAEAEDLVADVFEVAVARWARFDPRRGRPITWLCGIARNRHRERSRAAGRRRRREDRDHAERLATLAPHAIPDPPDPALRAALAALGAEDRAVIALRVLLELTTQETAEVMGISPSAVTTRLARALARCRAHLRETR